MESAEAALRQAEEWRAKGRHDHFRGQVRDWRPLAPSLLRLDAEHHRSAVERLNRFSSWVSSKPELAAIAKDTDAVLAVAQHYGLPTTFLDFTTDPAVALFFATHSSSSRSTDGAEGVLLCLSSSELVHCWRTAHRVRADLPLPELLSPKVPDLWRLEAQSGRFLFTPYRDFERLIYDCDRILFRNGPPLETPRTEDIYPQNKSQLEVLLDEYFMSETVDAQEKEVRRVVTNHHPLNTFTIAMPNGANSAIFIGGDLPEHPSWGPDALKSWLSPPAEQWRPVAEMPTWGISSPAGSPMEIWRTVSEQVARLIRQAPWARNHSVRWQITISNKLAVIEDEGANAITAVNAITEVWDGLRRLPYSVADIAQAIGTTAALAAAPQDRSPEDTATQLFGPVFEVEFGTSPLAFSRGLVARRELLGAVRPDLGSHLVKEAQGFLTDIDGLLASVNQPSELFEFLPLARLFARQIAPFQVVFRKHARFFSPAGLDTFGLP